MCSIAAIVEYAIQAWLVGSILIVVLLLNASIGWCAVSVAGDLTWQTASVRRFRWRLQA